ncbi:TPA: phage antirepressor [Pseudomonas aeruginosa]|nr:phage antirepressor [Pseudomonas aeruginosa]
MGNMKVMNDRLTMTSLELVGFVNAHRKQQAELAGQPFPSKGFAKLEHKHFLDKVPEVLGERSAEFSADLPDSYGRPRRGYRLPKREACLMAMSYSYELQAAVFDHMTALEEKLAKPLTAAEQLLASVQLTVELERRQRQTEQQQAQQQVAIERIEQHVEDLAESRVWDHCPQNCMPITRIREVIHERYGLSATVVNAVVRQMPNSPKPWGMVRNSHESAQGSQYAVWATSDITAVFKRFVSECEMVSVSQATHPYFEGRFRLVPKVK